MVSKATIGDGISGTFDGNTVKDAKVTFRPGRTYQVSHYTAASRSSTLLTERISSPLVTRNGKSRRGPCPVPRRRGTVVRHDRRRGGTLHPHLLHRGTAGHWTNRTRHSWYMTREPTPRLNLIQYKKSTGVGTPAGNPMSALLKHIRDTGNCPHTVVDVKTG